MKVYKYVPFSDGSLQILKSGTMKFTNAPEFNDPFDCVVQYDVESSLEAYMSRSEIVNQVAYELELTPDLVLEHREEIKNRMRSVLESGTVHDTVMEKVGICSLSKTYNNILMWSHYADHHKGFVVEFDVNLSNEKLVKEPEFYFGGNDVEYSHEMPVKVIGTTNFSDIYRQFLVKSEDWAYEQEYRVLSTNKGAGIHEFDHTMISAVIFGAKMSIENMNKLKDEVSIFSHKFKHSVSIIKAKVAPDKYALEFENIT